MELLNEKWIYADQTTAHEYDKRFLIVEKDQQPYFSKVPPGEHNGLPHNIPNCARILCSYCSRCATSTEHSPFQLPHDQHTVNQLLEPFPWLLTLRAHSKGFGNFSKNLLYHADNPVAMTIIFHSSMKQYWQRSRGGSIWSLGLVYDFRHNSSVGLLDGLLPSDRKRLECSLASNPAALAHPLAVPCAVLETQTTFLVEAASKIHGQLYKIEKDFGLYRSWGPGGARDPWALSNDEFQDYMKRSASIESHLTYLRGQADILMRFNAFLLETSDELLTLVKNTSSNPTANTLSAVSGQQPIQYWRKNLGYMLETVRPNIDRSSARIEKFSATVSTVMNHKISTDTSHTASLATLLSIITMIFLPATAIATFFSMSMFSFQNDAVQVVSSRLWIYWAVVAPLTVVILALCYLWTRRKSFNLFLSRKRDNDSV
ncbi:hypothetical protein BGW36DRAFT_409600 [Talaromyces proteolyticus]|uniref:Uncharacterized protein n=1 Tax=Talaromyces proteolyticus TaxID=1131652 RepID=A0AAD4PVZ2_9EURO|nr:uncharacterized protein BGW36DRAFT_409600 [Talaromyces proteolyticus]KAH8694027.1 hypothetical protein BGW36DRAFT_409600 [Talaromyces proteolyticus]